ncbi:ladinin-1 isoform X1 [Cyprinodon tularosa]|uniref:ladinin-1 isoform X1 n=1 Tax=Cyprinodon tularosa TaxID=77115 RepID=UPI0018E22045|nr:ladinin-1 isoform X1 [Cyprinodon tularosa]
MSISRKNWSALSSLARQWTMEDEEEAEREKRRRVKSSTAEQDADTSPAKITPSTSGGISGTESSSETSQGQTSIEQMQLDFVEMLRVRDEKRRMRHVEVLRRQKEEEEGNLDASREEGGEGDGRVVLLGELDEEKGSVFKPQPPAKTTSYSTISNSKTVTNSAKTQPSNGESSRKDPTPEPKPAPNAARKFVSSVSISLDKTPSGRTTPMSPCSPSASLSPQDPFPSPCQSTSSHGSQSPVQNGHTQAISENGSSTSRNFEQVTKPAFVRQSSRTISFRMMKKKEEDISPLKRSASVRMASKKFEMKTDQNEDEDKGSFQRNSRQRVSSRSIKEKMEQLAQAAQRSDVPRSADVTQRTLVLLEEVSRKRGLFEKDQKEQSSTGPGTSRSEFRNFASGMSDRINSWLNKSNQPGSPLSLDLRHVDISSKRSLFENRGEESAPKASHGKTHK